MKIRKFIVLASLTGVLLAGLAPITLATEDGQFPEFPTVLGDLSASSTAATPTATVKKTTVKKTANVTEETTVIRDTGVRSKYPTNETGVFSPFGYVKQRISARAEGDGVALALEPLDAKPTSRGDLRYQISYANYTSETLRNVVIQVALPKNFQYLDSDFRPDSKGNGLVTYDLGKVASGEAGAITLEVRARKQVKDAFLSASMSYEDIDGNAHVVNATASNSFNGKNGGGLSASILDGVGGFMIWLFVIILIIALAFVAYNFLVLKASTQPRT